MLDAKTCRNLAEREGFEPSVPGKGYARLAIRPEDFTGLDALRLNGIKTVTAEGFFRYENSRRVTGILGQRSMADLDWI
jgi:hypothetical protein